MTIYILFEGINSNDSSMVTTFYKLARAMTAFKTSKYAYRLLNQYEGSKEDTMETYINTLAEKKT